MGTKHRAINIVVETICGYPTVEIRAYYGDLMIRHYLDSEHIRQLSNGLAPNIGDFFVNKIRDAILEHEDERIAMSAYRRLFNVARDTLNEIFPSYEEDKENG